MRVNEEKLFAELRETRAKYLELLAIYKPLKTERDKLFRKLKPLWGTWGTGLIPKKDIERYVYLGEQLNRNAYNSYCEPERKQAFYNKNENDGSIKWVLDRLSKKITKLEKRLKLSS